MFLFYDMGKFIVLLSFLGLPVFAAGQQTNSPDSQLQLRTYAKEDTHKVNLSFNIGKAYLSANEFDSALYYYEACERLISKVVARQYEHRCFHEFVKIYHAQAAYRPALDYCLRAIETA